MLNRVALDREKAFTDVVLDFVPDRTGPWPDLVEVAAGTTSTRVRLRAQLDELEVLAVALDGAVRGGSGEVYFRPTAKAGAAGTPSAAATRRRRERSHLPLQRGSRSGPSMYADALVASRS